MLNKSTNPENSFNPELGNPNNLPILELSHLMGEAVGIQVDMAAEMQAQLTEEENRAAETIISYIQKDKQKPDGIKKILNDLVPKETRAKVVRSVMSVLSLFVIFNLAVACTPKPITANENTPVVTNPTSVSTEATNGVEVTETPDIGATAEATDSGLNFGEGIDGEQQADAEEFYATDDGAQQTEDLLNILQAEGVVNLEFVTLNGFYINPNNPEDIRAFIEIFDDSYERATHIQFISPLNDRGEAIFLSRESASEALGISDVDFYQDSEGFLRIFTEVDGVRTDVGIVNVEGQYSADIPSSLTGLRALIAENNEIAAAGSATEVPTNEPTEVVATPYEGIVGFPETWSRQFSLEYNNQGGAYIFVGMVEEISFSREGERLSPESNIEATSFLLVSYYDSNGQAQEILVGASFQDETYEGHGNAIIFGKGTNNSQIFPDYYVQGIVNRIYSAGDIVSIIFGTPNATIALMDNVGYTNDLINSVHSEAQFAAFATTGDPSDLGSEVLVPFSVDN